jgi:hypothetical protein
MATTYATLKTEIADFINRTNITTVVDTFIDQAEAEMQVLCAEEGIEFEERSTVTVTAGIAALPTGFLSARSAIWNGDSVRPLTYMPPDRWEAYNACNPTFTNFFTIIGEELRFAAGGDGDAILVFNSKFTPLSDSNTSNSVLAEFPSAYLYGSLVHAATYDKDAEAALGYKALFNDQMRLFVRRNKARKYAGTALAVRPA